MGASAASGTTRKLKNISQRAASYEPPTPPLSRPLYSSTPVVEFLFVHGDALGPLLDGNGRGGAQPEQRILPRERKPALASEGRVVERHSVLYALRQPPPRGHRPRRGHRKAPIQPAHDDIISQVPQRHRAPEATAAPVHRPAVEGEAVAGAQRPCQQPLAGRQLLQDRQGTTLLLLLLVGLPRREVHGLVDSAVTQSASRWVLWIVDSNGTTALGDLKFGFWLGIGMSIICMPVFDTQIASLFC